MKFIDLFSGIGGFRLGMEHAGHECAGYCEIDKFARKSYQSIFDTEREWTANDIRTVTDDDLELLAGKGIDVLCGGFPCQAFSIAGERRGFSDTRGTLFFEIARFAKKIKPRHLFCENIKGLLSHDKGKTFATILSTLDELGYDAEWQVLNSKDFGVPQNRERVFIIGHLRGASTRKIFPFGENKQAADELQRCGQVSNTLTARYGDAAGNGSFIAESERPAQKINVVQKTFGNTITIHKDETGTLQSARLDKIPMIFEDKRVAIPVMDANRMNKTQNGRRFKENGEPMFTLTGQDRHGVAIIQRPRGANKGGLHENAPTVTGRGYQENNYLADGLQIRKLTPRECWRLQGFPDWAFDRAQKVNSDSQLYKQAGNSVTVNVIYEIAKRL